MRFVKYLLFAALIVLNFVFFSHAQVMSNNDALDVLAQWEGEWKSESTMKPSVWFPREIDLTGSSETKLVLQESYLETNVNDSVLEGKEFRRYNRMSNTFNKWVFKSDGSTSFWYGTWNEKKKTMTWKYVDVSESGIHGKMTETFTSEKEIKTQVVMKDKKGNILLNVTVTSEKY